jgi:hypothetical protein
MRKEVLRDDEIDIDPMPKKLDLFLGIKVSKSKVVLKDDNDDHEPKIEICESNGGGLNFTFTTRQEVTTEDLVECDQGHKHRKIVLQDYTYETLRIGRRERKLLLAWLNGERE